MSAILYGLGRLAKFADVVLMGRLPGAESCMATGCGDMRTPMSGHQLPDFSAAGKSGEEVSVVRTQNNGRRAG